ncbi:MAG: hypothetical protein ACERKZ_07345 [Lachnotalea sp.]
MNEQAIILIFLLLGLGGTLWLYFLKAIKQVKYMGDERWGLIQLKANNIANIANGILIILLVFAPLFVDSQTTFTLQRVITLGLFYLGVRNLIELFGVIYFDKKL